MSSLVIRPLTTGETVEFDPLPGVHQMTYAEGLAGGGFHPSRTWIAVRDGEVVARAAWVLPPGAVGGPWLERFDLHDSPAVGGELLRAAHAALGGPRPYYAALPPNWRSTPSVVAATAPAFAAAGLAGLSLRGERLRLALVPAGLPAVEPDSVPAAGPASVPAAGAASVPAAGAASVPAAGAASVRAAGAASVRAAGLASVRAAGPDQVRALVARVGSPDVLTGSETARAVLGIDLATDPLPWLTGAATAWHVAPDGVVGTAGEACWPMIGYLGVTDGSGATRRALLAEAVRVLVRGGAEEVVADVDADRPEVLADLAAAGFRPRRARLTFEA